MATRLIRRGAATDLSTVGEVRTRVTRDAPLVPRGPLDVLSLRDPLLRQPRLPDGRKQVVLPHCIFITAT